MFVKNYVIILFKITHTKQSLWDGYNYYLILKVRELEQVTYPKTYTMLLCLLKLTCKVKQLSYVPILKRTENGV